MQVTTPSSKIQITAASQVGKRLVLKAGSGLGVNLKNDSMALIPEEPTGALRGLFAGQSAQVPREADRT